MEATDGPLIDLRSVNGVVDGGLQLLRCALFHCPNPTLIDLLTYFWVYISDQKCDQPIPNHIHSN